MFNSEAQQEKEECIELKQCGGAQVIPFNKSRYKVTAIGINAFKGINSNALIKVPKKKIKAYKKIIKAADAGKNIIVINLYMVYYGM